MSSVQPNLTASEAAERLTAAGIVVSEDTVRRWAKRGQLSAIELPSGRLLFRPEDIDALTSAQRISAEGAA